MGECCSVERNETLTELQTADASVAWKPPQTHLRPVRKVYKGPGSKLAPVSEAATEEFFERAEKGINLVVLLASGVGIECQFSVDLSRKMIVLKKDELKKEIPFSKVAKIMHTPEEMRRIKTEAPLDEYCSAIFLQGEDSCVVFSFDSVHENQAFIAASTKILLH